MKHPLPAFLSRLLLLVLLTAALGSCSLYRKVVHPYRLPTPKPSPEFIAQQKAKEKAHKAQEKAASDIRKTKKDAATEEAATDVSTPSGGALATTAATPAEARTLPERPTVRYDKRGMMKKPKLMRRRVHKYHKPFRPWQSIRSFFKFGLHAKPNYSPDHKPAPKQPANADLPDEAMPEPKAEPTPPAAPEPAPVGAKP